MIPALARFVTALRAEGVGVSPAEIIDASRAIEHVGLEDRGAFRSALRATLAKSPRAVTSFERLFDAYFVAPRGGTGTGEGRPAAGGAGAGGAGRGSSPESRPPRPRDDPDPGDPRRRSASNDKSSDRAASREPAMRDRSDRPTTQEGLARPGDRIDVPSGDHKPARHDLHRQRRSGADERASARRPSGADVDSSPRRANLDRRMTTDDERRIAREVPRMLREIRLRAGRRLERARTGRPWVRRALRTSLRTGGVPFVLPFRRPKRKTSQVVLLVDVSFSVARAAGLFLLMAAEVLEIGRRARIVVFVDKPVDATHAIARWARFRTRPTERATPRARARRGSRPGEGIESHGVAFADVLDALPELNLDAPSDYGRAFHALYASKDRPRGRDKVLVVLGDGRTNRFDPLPWVLEDLARGCRAVLWLVPEPASRWGTADSALPSFLPSVDVVAEATDLDGLARGLASLMRKL